MYAEELARPLYRWIDQGRFERANTGENILFHRGGIGLSVLSYSNRKSIRLRLSVHRQDGCTEYYVLHPVYVETMNNGREKWQTDQLPLFPWHSLHGPVTYITFSYILHAGEQTVYPLHEHYFACAGDFAAGRIESAPCHSTGGSDYRPFALSKQELERSIWECYRSQPLHRPYFTRGNPHAWDHPMNEIHSLMNPLAERGSERPYLHAALFNFDNEHFVNHLIHLAGNGVSVECIGGWEQISGCDMSQPVARLRRFGIPVYGLVRNTPFDHRGGIASMHTKFIVFNGENAMSASYNLDFHRWGQNWENGIFYYSSQAALGYEHVFQTMKGAAFQKPFIDPGAGYNLYYSLGKYASDGSDDLTIGDILAREIYSAGESIVIVMFDLSDFLLSMAFGKTTLFSALEDALARGVTVTMVLNGFKNEQQKDRPTAKDGIQRLIRRGAETAFLYNRHDGYSPLHHKYAVIDGVSVMAESANWYPATLYSDEVFSVIRNRETAQAYLRETAVLLDTFRLRTGAELLD